MLNIGDKAPLFEATDQNGKTVKLTEFLSNQQNVVLYFYPRDDTPGCTKEACGFRDHFAEIKKRGAQVLGVSKDPTKSHEKFARKFDLPFPLLSDEDHKIAEAYGVWGEKKFMGRAYMGMNRVTFLIGGDGRVKKIWPQVKPDEHAAEVLEALKR